MLRRLGEVGAVTARRAGSAAPVRPRPRCTPRPAARSWTAATRPELAASPGRTWPQAPSALAGRPSPGGDTPPAAWRGPEASAGAAATPVSAYVHLPFCRRKCRYCDFPVVALGGAARNRRAEGTEGGGSGGESDPRVSSYVEAVLAEIRATPRVNGRPLETVSFGGGTPSLVAPRDLERIVEALDGAFGLSPTAEVGLEADPGTFDLERLRAYSRLARVTRVSVGVQAFQERLLAACGRSHGTAEVHRALRDVRAWRIEAAAGPGAGPHALTPSPSRSFSIDLMVGLPTATEADWEESLRLALEAEPDHVSCYDLQLEPGTPFASEFSPGAAPLPSHEATAEALATAAEALAAGGLTRYEVSNFSRPGTRCRHNELCWRGSEYYAFGMGAASYVLGRRFARPRTLRGYLTWLDEQLGAGRRAARSRPDARAGAARHPEAPAAGSGSPAPAPALARQPSGPSQLSGAHLRRESGPERLADHFMLGLRTAEGVRLADLPAELGRLVDTSALERPMAEAEARGLCVLERDPESGRLAAVAPTNPLGYLLSNDLILAALEGLDGGGGDEGEVARA